MDYLTRMAKNEWCSAVMMTLCQIDVVKLETLDLWVKLQGYYFFATAEERQEIDQRGESFWERLNVTREVWDQGLSVLKTIGFIEDLGPNKWRLLQGSEVIRMLAEKVAA